MRLRKKSETRRRRRQVLAGSGVAAAGALAGAGLLRRRSRDNQESQARQEWQCECGETLLVTGNGLHRVFWRVGAPPEDPLLDDKCPNCERMLSLQG